MRQSSFFKSMEKREEIDAHNDQMLKDYYKDEDGLKNQPFKLDFKLFKKQVNDELNELGQNDP